MEKSCNSKRQKPEEVNEEDRFSNLPDPIAHHVFSFLTNIEDIARLSFTSKRCEQLCLSVPSFTIDLTKTALSISSTPTRRLQFLEFLVSLIAANRRRHAKLTSLTIRGGFHQELSYKETCRIMSILNNAIQCRVKEVELDLKLDEKRVFVMPLDLFYSESFTSLKLNMNYGELELPYPFGFSHLECLHLNGTIIDHADFGMWVSSFCKFLKKLYLKDVYSIDELKIASSSLKLIDIEGNDIHNLNISSQSLESICLRCSSSLMEFTVCAPNVLSLSLRGDYEHPCSLGKMNLLQKASLQLYTGMDGLLSSIGRTRHLVITSDSIKVLCNDEYVPVAFDNLQTLELQYSYLTDDVIRSTAKFFQGLQLTMKSLHIKPLKKYVLKKSFTSGCRGKFWEAQNIMFLKGLENLTIGHFGGKNEEALIEYLLKNAIKLKKAVIFCGTPLPTKIATKMLSAALAIGAHFRTEEGMMIFELKPQN